MFRLSAVALLLAGCVASRDAPADIMLHSAKEPQPVAACIQAQWMEYGPGFPAILVPRGAGYAVTLHGYNNDPVLLADAVPEASGSSVAIRYAYGSFQDLAERARGCL